MAHFLQELNPRKVERRDQRVPLLEVILAKVVVVMKLQNDNGGHKKHRWEQTQGSDFGHQVRDPISTKIPFSKYNLMSN